MEHMKSKKPLDGLRVVELSSFVAAPSSARLLCDMGAEVVKIEPFTGDPWRVVGKNIIRRGDAENPIYDIYNAGKKSICVDIKKPEGMECLHRLLERADVFITNMRPRSLVKAGLNYETLKLKYPRLIYATITGYGDCGADANSPGFDGVAYWTRSGFLRDMSIDTGNSYPVLAATGMGDTITGTTLYGAIATALYQRECTGKGDAVTVSLYGTAIWTMSAMMIRAQEKYQEIYPHKRYDENAVTIPYRCGDGEWFGITILEYDRYAPTFYKLLGVDKQVEALGVNSYMSMREKGEQLIPILEKAFLKKSAQEWLEIFKAADIVCCIMTGFSEVTRDPQAWDNGFVETVHMRNGEDAVLPRTPMRFSECVPDQSVVAAMPGDQTDEILASLGYSSRCIAEMKQSGAVK